MFDLPPMVRADDAVEGLGSLMRAVSEGKISPSEGAALATIVNSYSRAIDVADTVVVRAGRGRDRDKEGRH